MPTAVVAHWASVANCEAPVAADWFAAVCGLHDLGKATPGFQAKWSPGAERCTLGGFDFPRGSPDRHDASTSAFLREQLIRKGVDRITASLVADAVGAHHGFFVPPTEVAHIARFGLGEKWAAGVSMLVDLVVDTVVGTSPRPRVGRVAAERAALAHWLAGLCSVSDWIGSNASLFPHGRNWTDAATHYQASRERACRALDALGFESSAHRRLVPSRRPIEVALAAGREPRPLQCSVRDALSDLTSNEPALLIIEAPMGEGKTEAALVVDAVLRERGLSRGLYLALPTQATSNAMFSRVAEYLARLSADGGESNELQLAHGGASSTAAAQRLTEIGFGENDHSVQASAWFATGKRTLLAANAVGTVDQALVGVLNAKHHFVRLFGLSGRVVVLDEVHAYDAYTGGLIESLAAWLRALRCTVVLMSATLPRDRLKSLINAFGGLREVTVAPYPRLTFVQSGIASSRSFPSSRSYQVMLQRLSPAPDAIAEQALKLAGTGACVLVVCNTVARAQAVFRRLGQRPNTRLFHARYPLDERLDIERAVVSTLGGSSVEREGAIVVATQVVEQSLDIDADAMISDLAPIDLLLQRVGRLHRHVRLRPSAVDSPTVWVAGLNEYRSVGRPEVGSVYHAHPMLRTAALLRERHALALPVDIDGLVQRVYATDSIDMPGPDAHSGAMAKASADWQLELARLSQLAAQASIATSETWTGLQQAAPQDDESATSGLARFGTRLGSASLSVVPLFLNDSGLAVHADGPSWPTTDAVPAWAAQILCGRWLRLSHPRLIRPLLEQTLPKGWDAHPGLCHHRPLILSQDGKAEVGSVILHLDSRLGLVYEDRNSTVPASATA